MLSRRRFVSLVTAAAGVPAVRLSAQRRAASPPQSAPAQPPASIAGPLADVDVRTWQEDESPYTRVAQGLADRGILSGRVGIEETAPFVFADGVAAAAPALRVVSATPVTAGCRMIKDPHEIDLMRLA